MNDRFMWEGIHLRSCGGLFNDRAVDRFIEAKHAWSKIAVRELLAQQSIVRVLETNAGYGWLTATYVAAGATVTCIEKDKRGFDLLEANMKNLPVSCWHSDNTKALSLFEKDKFDVIDIDPSGSPQPVLDMVLERGLPRILFVTAGEGLHARLNRKPDNKVMLARYGDVWRENWDKLDRGAKEFGRMIVFEYIRQRWPQAVLRDYTVWPLTSSARLFIEVN